MKITNIKISDFHQFKDLNLELKYPNGHIKEGKPLDKVCFIGQSGTGKTTLLELIPKILYSYNTNLISISGLESLIDNVKISIVFGENEENSFDTFFLKKEDDSIVRQAQNVINVQTKTTGTIWEIFKKYQDEDISKLIYFPSNINYDIELESEISSSKKQIIDFSKENVSSIWNLILEKIQVYQEKELQIRQDISKVVEKSSNDISAIQSAVKKLEEWKDTEDNPIQDIAFNCLNPLLLNFKLRVKTELDFKTKDDIGFIKIEDFDGNEIPNALWSTGTKQVILSSLPMYLLKPKNTVILFDEPERSLYPDLQRLVVDYYTSLAANCQFFYSTHSPIIASNFEPWEIVELKFDESGHIYRELYFDGENHVDNYKWNPKYMRWDDILQRIFDLENDGSIERKEKLDELATLNVKYKKLVKKGTENSDEAVETLKKIEELSKKLSKWD